MTLQKPEQLNTISRIDEPAARPEGKRGIPLRTATAVFSLLAFLTAAALFLADRQVNYGYENIQRANDRNFQAEKVTNDLAVTSDYLTDRVRCYVSTYERPYMEDFITEVTETRRRDKAVEALEGLLGDRNHEAYDSLAHALERSDDLVQDEFLAMRLVLDANQLETLPEALADCKSLETISINENPMEDGLPRAILDKKGLKIDQ